MNWREGKGIYMNWKEGKGIYMNGKEGNGIYMSGLKIFEIYDMRPSFHGSKLLHTIWV